MADTGGGGTQAHSAVRRESAAIPKNAGWCDALQPEGASDPRDRQPHEGDAEAPR